jgi:hypothetical protein
MTALAANLPSEIWRMIALYLGPSFGNREESYYPHLTFMLKLKSASTVYGVNAVATRVIMRDWKMLAIVCVCYAL